MNPDIKFYSGDAKTLVFPSPRLGHTVSFEPQSACGRGCPWPLPRTQQCHVLGDKTTRPRWLDGHTQPCFMWQVFPGRGKRVRLSPEMAASNSCCSGMWLLPSRGLGGWSPSLDSRWPVTSFDQWQKWYCVSSRTEL